MIERSATFLYFSRVPLFIGWIVVSACSRLDLPSVPPLTPYQPPAASSGSSDHGQGNLTIAVPENRPPYFNGATDDGIERDIIRDSFLAVGLYPEFMETADRHKKYDSKRFNIECVSTVSEDSKLSSESYFSNLVVSYHYTPITLKKSGIVIKNYKELAGRTVEAFSLASKYLGEDFLATIPKMLNYAEHFNRSSQVALLLHGRVDVLVIDRTMFQFILKNLRSTRAEDYDAEVFEVPVEKVVDFKMACHNKSIVDTFNKGLATVRSTHRYEAIFDRYLSN